jgi:hypothetical protein
LASEVASCRRKPLTDVSNSSGESAGVDAKLSGAGVQAGKKPAAIAVGWSQRNVAEHRDPAEVGRTHFEAFAYYFDHHIHVAS